MNRLFQDKTLCRVGFGTWPLGGPAVFAGRSIGHAARDRRQALAALDQAVGLGINFFDTADIYGLGRAEELLGEALAGRREQAVICTKFGNREDAAGRRRADFSVAWLRHSVEGSLRRLGTDYLDLLLLHGPPDDTDWAAFDPTPFDRLVSQGSIRAYGVSSRTCAGAKRVIEAGVGRVVEVIYNAMDRRIEPEVLPLAAASGVAVIARVPLAKGFLSERYLHEPATFAPEDHRRQIAQCEQEWMAASARALGFLADLPGGVATSALRFCLSDPRVSVVIPGMSTPEQVVANYQAAVLGPLPDAVRRRIAETVPSVFPGWQS